jgi:hypothetical protein
MSIAVAPFLAGGHLDIPIVPAIGRGRNVASDVCSALQIAVGEVRKTGWVIQWLEQ